MGPVGCVAQERVRVGIGKEFEGVDKKVESEDWGSWRKDIRRWVWGSQRGAENRVVRRVEGT